MASLEVALDQIFPAWEFWRLWRFWPDDVVSERECVLEEVELVPTADASWTGRANWLQLVGDHLHVVMSSHHERRSGL